MGTPSRGWQSSDSSSAAQVEPPQGIPGDDTALNGIRLHCARGNAELNTHVVESQSGRWGAGAEDPLGSGYAPYSPLHASPTDRQVPPALWGGLDLASGWETPSSAPRWRSGDWST